MRYSREDGCRAWLMYGLFSPGTLSELLERFGSADAIYTSFLETGGRCLRDLATEKQTERLRSRAGQRAMHTMMKTMQRLGAGVLSVDDVLYPDLLREIQAPPPILMYRGDPRALRERSVTIVGTRKCTPQGMGAAQAVAEGLARSGVTIVSGLAAGIDSAAHEGSLAAGTPAVGVCACGVDVNYPECSHSLKERILADGGLLLSEYPLGQSASKWVFEQRNRLMSGLSRATILMEGRSTSGALITVRHALDQGREVFAWPGVTGSECAQASHDILREGARFFTTADDVLEDLGWDRVRAATPEEKAALPELSADQRRIVSALRMGEQSMDQLAVATGLDVSALGIALTMLQITGVIRTLPGKIYALV